MFTHEKKERKQNAPVMFEWEAHNVNGEDKLKEDIFHR